MPVRGQSPQKRTFSAKTSAVPPLSAVAIREASLPAAAAAALHVEAELHHIPTDSDMTYRLRRMPRIARFVTEETLAYIRSVVDAAPRVTAQQATILRALLPRTN